MKILVKFDINFQFKRKYFSEIQYKFFLNWNLIFKRPLANII